MNLTQAAAFSTLKFIALLSSMAVVYPSTAGTVYVEKWGTTDSVCGAKTAPCKTIARALDNASPRGKIVVGPGRYTETDLDIDLNGSAESLEGLKIESVAGRYATTIRSASSGFHALEVRQPRGKIGRKGRGFTFIGATGSTIAGLRLDASYTKVEGNRFGIVDSTDSSSHNGRGIHISGERNQVRFNEFHSNSSYGIYCSPCDRALIQDNRIMGTSNNALYFNNSDQVVLQRNVVVENTGNGLLMLVNSEFMRLKDNVFADNALTGVQIEDGDGSVIQGNIVADNWVDGVVIRQNINAPTPMKIKDNLSSENGDDGFRIQGQQIRFDGNTAVANGDDGFDLFATVPPPTTVSSFNKGNIWSNDGCGMENNTLTTLKYTRLFAPDNSVCDFYPVDTSSTAATRPNPIRVNRARSL